MIQPYDYSYRGLIYRALTPQEGDPDAVPLLTRALDYAPADDRGAIKGIVSAGGVTSVNRPSLQAILDRLSGEGPTDA